MTGLLNDVDSALLTNVFTARTRAALESFFGTAVVTPVLQALGVTPAPPSGTTVMFLPGILGTTLDDDGDAPEALWLNVLDGDALGHLLLKPGPTPAADRDAVANVVVTPDKMLLEAYCLMDVHFRFVCGFEVIPFPYDWRRSIDALAEGLLAALPAGRFSVVAHSMGCLVLRRCAQLHPEIVDRLDHAVFMGPPFKGSFVPLRVLAGYDWLGGLFSLVETTAPDAVLGTCPGFLEMAPDVTAFPTAAGLLQNTGWTVHALPPFVASRAIAFGDAFRRGDGAAQVGDAALMAKASIVLGANLLTVDRIDAQRDANGRPTFPEDGIGDSTVPVESAWDDSARAHYAATAPHPFIAQEPAVILGVADLVRSSGASAAQLTQFAAQPQPAPVAVQASLTRSVGSGLETVLNAPVPVQPEPAGFDERRAANRLTNADLYWLFTGGRDVAAPLPAVTPPIAAPGTGVKSVQPAAAAVPVAAFTAGGGVAAPPAAVAPTAGIAPPKPKT